MPAAGSIIRSQASVTWLAPGALQETRILSNTAEVRVSPLEALMLTADTTRYAVRGARVQFPHTLTNTGNTSSKYSVDLTVLGAAPGGTPFVPAETYLVLDRNGNGIEDSGDIRIGTGTPAVVLAPGERASLIIAAGVPSTANHGDSVQLRIGVRSEAQGVSASNTDTVLIRDGAVFTLNKTADVSHTTGGGVVNYSIDASNAGNAEAAGTANGRDLNGGSGAIRIDGVPATVVLLHDKLPANTRFVSASLNSAIAGAQRLWHAAGDAPFSYRSSEMANVDEVAIALPAVARNSALRMRFAVRVNDSFAGRVDNVGVLNFAVPGSTTGSAAYPTNVVPVQVDGVQGVDLTLLKSHEGNFHTDSEQAYTLRVNAANQASNGVITVVDTLPAGMHLVAAAGPLWDCDSAGQSVTCVTSQAVSPDSLSSPLTIKVRVPQATLAGQPSLTLTNRASVSGGGEPAAFTGNNSAEDATLIHAGVNLSGRVWLDLNHDTQYQNGEPLLAGWRAQLLLPVGNASRRQYRVIQEATSDDSGAYGMSGIAPRDGYALRFISPEGYQFGTPVDGETGVRHSGARPDARSGMLTGLSVHAGTDITEQSLPVNPTGVVYASASRQPLAGAAVRIEGPAGFDPARHLVGGTANREQRTGSSGRYQFLMTSDAPSGVYRMVLTSTAGYNASVTLPPQPGALNVPAGTRILGVQPQPQPPQSGESTTHYMQLSLVQGSRPVVNNHLPLDRASTQGLLLRKSASKAVVEVVDVVDYTLELKNQTGGALAETAIDDRPAAGFVYQPGSARLMTKAGTVAVEPLQQPDGRGGMALRFKLPNVGLASGDTMRVSYRLRVNVAALQGDGINRARALSGGIQSNQASARVKVVGGVFSEVAFLIGKVFLDCDRNGIQDAGQDEVGIPGVRLYLEDGSFVVTDRQGKYSFYGVRPLSHVLKLDLTTLPEGAQLGSAGNRNSVDDDATPEQRSQQASTRFVDLKKGELHKANFAEQSCAPTVRAAVAERRRTAATQRDEAAVNVRRDFKVQGLSTDIGDVRSRPQTGYLDPERGRPGGDLPGRQGQQNPPAPPNTGEQPAQAAAPAEPMEALLPKGDNALGFLNLSEGQILPLAQTSVMVKGRLGAQFRLTVNGSEVSADRVGKKSQLQSKNVQGWEYIGVNLLAGTNRIEVGQVDGFGNARGSAVVNVIAPGPLERLELTLPDRPMADGRTPARLHLRLLDRNGVLVTTRTQVTLNASIGQWLLEDLSPSEPGTQIFVEGGAAVLPLMAPTAPGESKIKVQAGNLREKQVLVFVPELRPMIAAGIVEGSINLNQLDFSKMQPVRSGDLFEKELVAHSVAFDDGKGSAAARAALFLKGKISGDYLLSAAYDSEKTDRDRLFRDIQPDQFYPVYGDSSQRGFDAQSSGRLYVRIDKDKSYLLYGDYTTASADNVRQLTQYSRALNGVKGHSETELFGHKVNISGFAAHDTQRQVVQEFTANGTSGPFQLRQGKMFSNSERVEVLTRDRDQRSLILHSEQKQRFVDYEIEALTGRLLFKGPIHSVDENLNPNSIRVTYEVDTGGAQFWVAGADAQVQVTEQMRVGVVHVRNDDPGHPFSMSGATAEYKFAERTTLSGEVAHTSSEAGLLDSVLTGQPGGLATNLPGVPGNNLPGPRSGNGARAEFRHEGSDLKVQAQYASTQAGFNNPSAPVSQGRTEITGKADYRIDDRTTLRGAVRSSKNVLSGGEREAASVGVERKVSDTVAVEIGALGYRDMAPNADASVAPYSGIAARAKVSARLPSDPNAVGYLEYEQDVNDAARRVATVGGEYRLTDGGRLYGRYEFLSSLDSRYALDDTQRRYKGLFGVERQYMKDGSVFAEYRMNDAVGSGGSSSAQAALGLRNLWSVSDAWRIGTTFETTQPLYGGARAGVSNSASGNGATLQTSRSGSLNERSVAATVAAEYVGSKDLKFSTRLEVRHASALDSYLHTAAVAYKISPDWTMLARNVMQFERSRDGSANDVTRLRQQIGAAYRPVDDDRFNLLTRYEHRSERLSSAAESFLAGSSDLSAGFIDASDLKQETHIFSTHANWQPERKLTLSARYAAKWISDVSNGLSSTNWAQMIYGRALWDVAMRWDAGVQAFATIGKGGARQTGFGAEAGYMVTTDAWVSAGYNFGGFKDADLAGGAQTNRGVYLRLRMKFDESLFDGLGKQ